MCIRDSSEGAQVFDVFGLQMLRHEDVRDGRSSSGAVQEVHALGRLSTNSERSPLASTGNLIPLGGIGADERDSIGEKILGCLLYTSRCV